MDMKFIRDERGSFTVEAAVIVSFMFFVIQAFIFLSFYLFNLCSVTRAAEMAALRASQAVWETSQERYNIASAAVAEILEHNLIGEAQISSKITSKAHKVTVEVGCKSTSWQQTVTASRNVIHPVQLLREARKIKKLGEDKGETEE
ncbi:MAG: pilus assembly protein [Lachnospiraceae bacterium]|nr:pilus assembly protein [Lachnospiraceae bacterium]